MKELIIEELLGDKYPHASFHDAMIEVVELDYLKRRADLQCVLFVGDPEADVIQREATAQGKLIITGLFYFVIEPPDEKQVYDEGFLGVSDDGSVRNTQFKFPIPKLPQNIPDIAFSHYFFVYNYNSFIFFAATGAEFVWD